MSATNNPVFSRNERVKMLIMDGGILDLNGYEIQINNEGYFNTGLITGGHVIVTGQLANFSGTEIEATVYASCDIIQLNGSEFHETCYFEVTAMDNSECTGSNTFHKPVTIVQGANASGLILSRNSGDVYHDSLTVKNLSDEIIEVSFSGESYYYGCIHLINEGQTGMIQFGGEAGISYLESDGHLLVENRDMENGILVLKFIYQQGDPENLQANVITLTGPGSPDAQPIISVTECIFTGEVAITAPNVLLRNNRFENLTTITKTGGNHNHCEGGNEFYGETTIVNTSETGNLRLANNSGDTYYGPVSFIGGDKHIFAGYSGTNSFYSDIYVESETVEIVNAVLTGNNDQTLGGSAKHQYENLDLNKSHGQLTGLTPIEIDYSMTFTSGILHTDTTNIITFLPGSSTNGAHNGSFISGPVKKIGNTAFEFPVGKGTDFRPISITATSNSTNAYQAEYFNYPQQHGPARDTTLEFIAYCNFWNLQRSSGTDKVAITVGWEQEHCGLYDSTLATVAWWDGEWKNLKVSSFDGTVLSGKITSQDSVDVASADISLTYRLDPVALLPIALTAEVPSTGRLLDHFFGLNGANMIQPGVEWDDPFFQEAISTLRPSTIRFPGGELGNWWDWRAGWFVDRNIPFQQCTGLPAHYESLTQKDNTLENFRDALGTIGSRPVFLMNMLTSNLPYQLAMLHEAEILGMPVRQVELGNEFYKSAESNCEYTEIFPSVSDYAQSADTWIEQVRERFVNADLAVIGTDNIVSTRENTWNAGLITAGFNNNPEAVTIHPYYGSGLGVTTTQCDVIDYSVNAPNSVFNHVFDVLTSLESIQWSVLDDIPNVTAWMTEYNLFERSKGIIHGSWAHGLKTAAFTLAMLEKDWITAAHCHTMVGDGVFSAFFSNTEGYSYPVPAQNPNIRFCSPDEQTNMSTVTNSLTSLGYALQEIGDAMRFAIEGRIITFDAGLGTIPSLGSRDAIYGWHFTDDEDNEQMVIINMSDAAVSIDLSSATNLSTPQLMKLVSMQGSGGFNINSLNNFVTNVSASNIEFVMLNPVGPHLSSSIPLTNFVTYGNPSVIPAYSLMRYSHFAGGVNSVTISSSENPVCQGRNFYLYANASPGATSYSWYNNDGTGNNLLATTLTPFYLTQHTPTNSYTVQVQFPGSVTITSNPISITQKDIPTLNVTTVSNEFCFSSNTPLELTAELTSNENPSNYRYCWIPIDGAEIHSDEDSQLTEEIEVMPQQNSTYIVYATDGKCSVREEITIDVIGNIDFGANPITFCSGTGPVTLSTGLDEMIWDFDWGNNIFTEEYDVNPTNPATYTVTVTNGPGCTVTASVDVLPIACCNPQTINADIIFLGPSDVGSLLHELMSFQQVFVTQLNNGSLEILNSGNNKIHIYVEDDFLVNQDIDIINFKFSFADRASMTVDNFRRVWMRNCELTACSGNMWQGVFVKERGVFNTFQNAIIRNAYYGVYSDYKTRLSINNTLFENNFTGIKSLGAPAVVMASFPKLINRGRFRSLGTLLAPYTNITTLPANSTDRGYAGVVAENDLVTVFSGTAHLGNYSTFNKLSNGIVATNSIMNISNTTFTDMQPETEYNWLGEQGVGVNSSGDFGTSKYTSLNFKGLGVESGDPVTFNNCITGISTEISALTVSNAKFSNLNNGIVSKFPYSQPVVILNNIINAEETGIGLYTADLSGHIDVRDNNITIDETVTSGNPTFGIGMFNAAFPLKWSVCRIKCNDITLGNAKNGIVVSGFKPYNANQTLSVSDNQIEINNNGATENGMLFQDVTDIFIQHNSVSGSDPTDATSTNAYKFFNSPSNVISQNSSDGTKVGFQFDFDCRSENNFKGNHMGDHFHGLELLADGKLDKQSYTGNTWGGYVDIPPPYEEDPSSSGDHIGAWAHPDFLNFPQALLQSQFIINSSSTLVHFPYYTPVSIDWFFPDIGSNPTFSYFDNCLAMPPLDPELRLGYGDSLVVYDSIISPGWEEEIKINSAYHLRDKLELIKQNEDIPTFFASYLSSYNSTAAGKISRYRDTLSLISNIAADSINFIVFNDSLLHSRLTDIGLLEDDNINDEDTLFEQTSTIISSLNQVRISSMEQLYYNIETIVYDLMDGVSTSHVIESNLKDSYLSFYNLILCEDTSEIKSVLITIANQCIKDGGPGVTAARNLLATMDSSIVYDEVSLCGTSRIGQNSILNSKRYKKQLIVFPNPSSGEFTTLLPKELIGQKINLNIYDLSGKLVHGQHCIPVTNNLILDLSKLLQGSYLLKIHSTIDNYYQKISIIK